MEKKIRPQDRWDEKAGIVAKTYKVDKQVAEKFKAVCSEVGKGQGPVITKLMKQFIEEVKASE